MALALYRKYRPGTFADVVGQEHVTAPLTQALSSGRINHAYLFSGPRGCGKTSSARILARSLNCVDGPTPRPCGTCDSCVALAPDGPGSIDVIEIDAASHGGVDDARDLRERAFFAPVASRYKVYIVDEAHMVTTQGFNALLKLVEEPPDFLIFIFATTEPDKVLPTIRSRTHHYPFRLLPPGVLRGLLESICTAENVAVEPAVLPLVVRAGGGSARDSESILDQLLAGAGDEGITYARAVALLGVTDAALLDDMVDALAAGDRAAVFTTVDRVVEAGHDPRRFAVDLLDRLRDLVIMDAVPEAVDKGIIDAPADQLERMTEQARRLGGATLSRLADVVHAGLTEMRGTTSPRLLLELVCARMLLPAASDDLSALLQRIERLERREQITGSASGRSVSPTGRIPQDAGSADAVPPRAAAAERSGGPRRAASSSSAESRPDSRPAAPADSGPVATTAPADPRPVATGAPADSGPGKRAAPTALSADRQDGAAPSAGPASAAPPPAPSVAASPRPAADPTGLDAAAVRRAWPDVLEAINRASRVMGTLMVNATVASLDESTLVLSTESPALARLMMADRCTEPTRAALHEMLGVDWRIRVVTAGDAGSDLGGAVPALRPPRPAAAREDAAGSATEPPAAAGASARDDGPVPAPTDAREDDPRDEEPLDDGEPASRQDPEEAAISLLTSTLGATKLDSD